MHMLLIVQFKTMHLNVAVKFTRNVHQVTGRIVKLGDLQPLPDVLALPDLDSPARNPTFHYKLQINAEKAEADATMTTLLRVYTVDATSGQVVVIGSCLLELFDSETVSIPHNVLCE